MDKIQIGQIPASGQEITISDNGIWDKPLKELNIDCKIISPIQAKLNLLPIQGGLLVRGKLTGHVVQPCDLCAEDAHIIIDYTIDNFEEIPGQSIPLEDEEGNISLDSMEENWGKDGHIIMENSMAFLDIDSLCWEEFMLALPLRPLCNEKCQGLCTICGTNLNEKKCTCVREEGDPRLATLRTLKIK